MSLFKQKRIYVSRSGKRHRLVWADRKWYLDCNQAIGAISPKDIILGFNVTCKNCKRSID